MKIAIQISPIANRQSPIANRQSPIANRQSPIANRQSPMTFIKAVFFAICILSFGGRADAVLISLQVAGTVTDSPNLPALVGESWTMNLVYDAAAPDQAPNFDTYGNYINTSTPPAIRSFYFEVGSYLIDLVDPDPLNPQMVRIDIDKDIMGPNSDSRAI